VTLTLYNTLTRKKEPFRPIDPNNVRMYVCGPTVYDYAHIGNARPVIVFDVLFRLLRHIYGADHVTYARNITDVDDKINARAAEQYPSLPLNEAIRKVTEATTRQFHEDIAALGVLQPTHEPRATEYIRRTDKAEDMVRLIEALVLRGHAYVAEEHVLFDVASMPDYGRLANRSLEEMEAGARVDVAPYKKGPMDFVLWKPSKPGEPSWLSPCGIKTPGRPGWHIECSAMAGALLGQTFDIHGGGIDLVFPHHENEIAQSRCAHGTPVMANAWMHNGFLQVEGEKMSKSLGNFVTIHELLKEWPGDVIRFQMLTTHYRQPLNWTSDRCQDAAHELHLWGREVSSGYALTEATPTSDLLEALGDDLNVPLALTALRQQFGRIRKGDENARQELARNCRFLGFRDLMRPGLFESGVTRENARLPITGGYVEATRRLRAAISNGLNQYEQELRREIEAWGVSIKIDEDRAYITLVGKDRDFTERVKQLINERNAARKSKNFKEADRIRDELSALGIQLKDAKNPSTGEIETTWEVKR
jgi:cysteinyl-tRNA synthetase